MRLAILVPAMDDVKLAFAGSLFSLGAASMTLGLESCMLQTVTSSYLGESRNLLARWALDNEFTHLLWIDSDMSFPMDALPRLLRAQQPMVGVNYVQRKMPFGWTAQKKRGVPLETHPDSHGLEEVERIGFGLVLMHAELLSRLERPWFDYTWTPDGEIHEDIRFCDLARAAGATIYVDHDLSKEILHYGNHGFGPAFRWARP